MDTASTLKAFIGLLAIVDPFIAIPLFLALTPAATPAQRNRIARLAAVGVFGVLAVSLLIGSILLTYLGISLSAFRIAGAILLLMSAISSFQAEPGNVRQNPAEEAESHDRAAIAIVPLATPLLAGPGAISWVIVYGSSHSGVLNILTLLAVIAGVAVMTWLSLRAASRVSGFMGLTGMNVATCIGALLTAALAIEIMATGLQGLFPVLKT
jgi:multiple antibiotic resistance protein